MSALSSWNRDRPAAPGAPRENGGGAAADYALGLQLCRAGILSLTRLQLAIERGDRPCAMEAIDDLGGLDSQVERIVETLSTPAEDERLDRIAQHLREEKMALAFERLALASGVSGPGMRSRAAFSAGGDDGGPDEADDAAAIWPPPNGARLSRALLQVLILLAIVAAVAGLLMAAL